MALTSVCGQTETPPDLSEDCPPIIAAPVDEKKPDTGEVPEYPGKTVDQIFPPVSVASLIDDDGREERQIVEVAGYALSMKDYVPTSLAKYNKKIFNFKPRESGGYWGSVVGVSNLLGAASEQLWVAVSGPGGVCCTNYSIVDISRETPRSIFHSEDFGSFREPMEIFDAHGDGVYELVQFDSCMRYFMGDCGSCSPEPRAHFKYDSRTRQYVAASGIAQEFYQEGLDRNEKWIDEKFREWKRTKSLGLGQDISRALLGQVSALLHMGDEKKAWSLFNRYGEDKDGEIRREIKRRLAKCKFYQALKRR
jgi:hypothetical protein